MVPVGSEYNPRSIEGDVLSLWRSRKLPPAGGMLGPPSGPVVRQYVGSWAVGDFPSLVAHRAVVADIDARYLCLAGRRAIGTLRQSTGTGTSAPTPIPALLTALGVWTGGDGSVPWDSRDRTPGVQSIVNRLATQGLLTAREETFRACPSCAVARGLERIVYDEQEGDTYLVRFTMRLDEKSVSALVWVDTPWKLLGTSALLVHPKLTYVVARYTRREESELVLTSRSSIERLRAWIPEARFEILEERAGRDLERRAYVYPLRHEFPIGGDLTAPAGTVLGAPDVDDSGTGIVPLVPGHGPTDAQIASRFGVAGWPLVTAKGKLDFTLMHKYAGLDLATTGEFVLRDLAEAGALFAHLRVRRGVPRCSLCGSSLFWIPGRAWCIEPSRMPADRRALFGRLLPGDSFPGPSEVAPWPISEASAGEEAGTIALLECARCERLEPVGGPATCPCGGTRTTVQRKLLHSVGGALEAWARTDPFPDGDSVHLYVGRRRRVPSVVNHLIGLVGVQGSIGDVNVSVVPTVTAPDIVALVAGSGADAVRAALLRSGLSDSPRGQFEAHGRQESDRLRRWWSLTRDIVGMCDVAMIAAFARPISGFLSELDVEDRAILARWERTRSLAVAHYDHWAPVLVLRRVSRFLDNDLAEYRDLVRPRLALAGTPTTKRGALRTFAHLIRGIAEVMAPIAPFTSEAVHRSLSPERTSLFERPLSGLDPSLLNEDLVASWDRWLTVVRALDEFRRSMGVPRTALLPSVALVVPAEDVGDRFRAEREPLARLVGAQRLEVGSPKEPWTGRQRTVSPVESEIQKAYPAQASQIIHLLSRMPPRRWEAALSEEELTVVINGLPRRIFPSMVTFHDTLPQRVFPQRWRLGEMYVELPEGTSTGKTAAPPMSTDAFWLARRVQRRLRSAGAPAGGAAPVAIVSAKGPLALELKAISESLARYLGLREVRVTESSSEPEPPGTVRGRTRTGERWWVHLPELPVARPKEKRRALASHFERITVSGPPPAPEVFDYTDPGFIAHEEAVRALGRELDDLIGVPLLGPAKISLAWEKGIHSVDDLLQWPTVAALPGFGNPIAEVVLARLRPTPGVPSTQPSIEGAPASPAPASALPAAPTTMPEVSSPAVPPPVSSPEPSEADSEPTEAPEPAPPAEEASTAPLGTEPPAPPDEPIPEGSTVPATSGTDSDVPVSPPEVAAGGEIPSPMPDLETRPLAAEVTVTETSPPIAEVPATGGADPSATPALADNPVAEPSQVEPGPMVDGDPTMDGVPEPELETPAPEAVDSPAPPVAAPSAVNVEGSPSLPEGAAPAELPSDSDSAEPAAPLPTPEAETMTPEPGPTVPTNAPEEATEARFETPEVPDGEPEPAAPSPTGAAAPDEVLPTGPEEPPEEAVITPIPAVEEPVAEPDQLPEEREVSPVSTEQSGPLPEPPSPPTEELGSPRPETVAPDVVTPARSPIQSPEPPTPTPENAAAVEPGGTTPLDGNISVPALEDASATESPVAPSGIELSVGASLVGALGGFLDATAAGHPGVCVVRESPERIRARVGTRPIDVLWLSNVGRGPSLRPSDLEGAFGFLSRKLVEDRVTAFFLEGIEYLVRLHGADPVLNHLVELDRLARENDARVWVYVNPGLLKPGDLDRFRSTFGHADAASP